MSGRWTEEEIAKIAAATAEEYRSRPRAVLVDWLVAAQERVAPAERLTMLSLRSYTKHTKALQTALTAVGVPYPNRYAVTPAMPPPPAPSAGLIAKPLPPSDPPLSQATQAQLLAQLLAMQTAEITRLVEESIAHHIAQAFEVPGSEGYTDDARHKPSSDQCSFRRYLIIGLLPVQSMMAKERLKSRCDLRFWEGGGTDKLRSGCGWADCVVSMTKFISHSTEDIVKKTGKPLLRCNGGVTNLVSQIQYDLENS